MTGGTGATDIATLPATRLRHMIGARQISPVELMDACIARIDRYNPAVNAITATDFDRARQAAKEAETAVMRGDPLGPLHGLPLGVKDVEDTAGLLTTFGNIRLRDNLPAKDSALVARLRAAGAIVTAKTNVPDMGAGANTRNVVWGATGNPFDPTLTAGGSSGGSAAALACDMLPLCTGSDMGGSLRIPAALCGVVGMRTSVGLVARPGRQLGWSTLPVLGPMGRSVADAALMLSASLGLDPHDPLSYPAAPETAWPLDPAALSGLRIGYTEDFGSCPVEPGVRQAFRRAIDRLRGEVALCEEIQFDTGDFDQAFDILRAEWFLATHSDTYRTARDTLGPNVIQNIELFSALSLADRARAHLEQTRIARGFSELLERYDVILCPTIGVSPFPWTQDYPTEIDGQPMSNYYQWAALSYLVTLATTPSIALPAGLDDRGMPFGLQVIGPMKQDGRLLRAAMAVETIFDRPRPDMTALKAPRPDLTAIVTHPPTSPRGGSRGAVGPQERLNGERS